MWIKDYKGGLVNLSLCVGVTIFKGEVLAFYGNGTDEQCLTLFVGSDGECKAYVAALYVCLESKGLVP